MVTRGCARALVVGDMPFLSYQVSAEDALRNAGRLIKEGGAEAVKLEGGVMVADTVRRLVEVDIPVMGHIGLTPQSVHRMGGYRVQGQRRGPRGRMPRALDRGRRRARGRGRVRDRAGGDAGASWRAKSPTLQRCRPSESAPGPNATGRCW